MATLMEVTVHPSGYSTDYTCASVSNISNGYTDHNSTTAATINLTTGSRATTQFDYTFDLSALPDDAYICDILCKVKASLYNIGTAYVSSGSPQLIIDGSWIQWHSASFTSSVSTQYLGGYISVQDSSITGTKLKSMKLRLSATRGTSSTSTTRSIAFYGATLTIRYLIKDKILSGNTTIGGVAKSLNSGHVNIGGVWKPVDSMYVNVGGVWKPAFNYESVTCSRWYRWKCTVSDTTELVYTNYQTVTASNFSTLFGAGSRSASIYSTAYVYDNQIYFERLINQGMGSSFDAFKSLIQNSSSGAAYTDFTVTSVSSDYYGTPSRFTYNSSNNTIIWQKVSIGGTSTSITKDSTVGIVESPNRNQYPDDGLHADGFYYEYITYVPV